MRRGTLLFAFGVSLVLAVVVLAYVFLLREPVATPAPAAPVSEVMALTARLLHTRGEVQVRSSASPWQEAKDGTELLAGAEVRTGVGADAEVAYGDDLRIRLASETDVSFKDLRASMTRLVIGSGLITADVRPGEGRRLFVTNASGEAVAETSDGSLSVSTTEAGELRAAVTRGSAVLTAHGESVTLTPGFYSVAGSGKNPAPPRAVPKTLLLKVSWPSARATAQRRHRISGITTPGTRVELGGRAVFADDEGRFRTVVDLQEGKQRVHVRALDMVGRELAESSDEIELDTSKPVPKIETSPDMWRK